MSGKSIEKKKKKKSAISTPWNHRENLHIVEIYLLAMFYKDLRWFAYFSVFYKYIIELRQDIWDKKSRINLQFKCSSMILTRQK